MNRALNQSNIGVFHSWFINICSPPTLDTGERVRRTLPGIVGILSSPLLFGYALRSISYGIIKDHSGEIEVAETGPSGTTFSIKLPIVDCNQGDIS